MEPLHPTSDAVMNSNLNRITAAIGSLESAVSGGGDTSALEARIATLESTVADLEARVAVLETPA